MKKTLILGFAALLMAVACKSKQPAAKSNTAQSSGASSTDARIDAGLAAIQTKYPDVTKDELLKGQSVFSGPCTNCHGQKDVIDYKEDEILHILDNMCRKAKVSADEKQAVTRYVMALRATAGK